MSIVTSSKLSTRLRKLATLSVVCMLSFPQMVNSQTTLSIGDLSILGFNANAPDNFAFVPWVNLDAGTIIKFSDNAFLSNAASTASNNFRGTENYVIWTAPSGGVTAGSIVTIESITTNLGTAVGGSTSGLSGLSNGGDQIFAYQGAATSGTAPDAASTNPATFTGTPLMLLSFGAAYNTTQTTSTNNTYLPSDLNVTNGNILFSTTSTSHGQYTGVRTGLASLLDYRTLVNNPANWTTGTGNAGTVTLNTTAFTIGGSGPATLTWNGSVDNNWDTATANWTGSATIYTDGNNVNFTNTVGGTVNLIGALIPGTITVSATAGTYTFAGASLNDRISGGASLVKSGAGILVVANDNDFTGGSQLNAGTVQVNTASSLGTGPITINGATLQNTASTPLVMTNSFVVGTSGGTINTGNQDLTIGAVTGLSGNLTKTGSSNLTVTGNFAGTGGSINISSGNLILAQASGNINLSATNTLNGNLILNNPLRLNINDNGTISGTGQILVPSPQVGNFDTTISNLSGNIGGTISVPIVLNSNNLAFTPGTWSSSTYTTGSFRATIGGTTGGSLTVNSVISGASDVDISNNTSGGGGRGSLNLNAANTYNGLTTINAGINDGANMHSIRIGVNNAFPPTSGVVFGTKTGIGAPLLDLNGKNQQFAFIADGLNFLEGNRLLAISNNGNVDSTLTLGGTVDVLPGQGSYGGLIIDGNTNKVSLVKTGTNTQAISGINFYSGGTTINQGTLIVNGSVVTTATTGIAGTLNTTDPLILRRIDVGVGETAGLVVGQPVTGTGIAPGTFLQQIRASSNQVILSKAPTASTVTMDFGIGGSGLGTGPVVVNAAGTLGGSGTIAGPVSGAGTIAPGSNGIGTLTINNTLNVTGGYQFEISNVSSTLTNDMIAGVTSLTYGGTLKISLDLGSDPPTSFTSGNSWDLFDFTTQTGVFSNNSFFGTAGDGTNLPTLSGGLLWNFNYTTGVLSISGGSGGPDQWTGTGNWSTTGNWQGAVPNSATAVASFLGMGTGAVTVDMPQTVNQIVFNDPGMTPVSYAISGPSTLSVAGATPSITNTTGSNTITAPLNLANGTTITVTAGSLAISPATANMVGTGVTASTAVGATLTLGGAGNALNSTTNITNNGTLSVTGTAQSVGNISGAGATTVSGAGTSATPTLVAKDIDQASLTISDGAYVRISPSGTSTSVVNSLAMVTTANLDITNNDLIVNNPTPVTAASSLTAVATAVNAGFAGGNGIVTTTTGLGLETVGFGLNSFLSYPTFNGVAVNDDSVLIKYTYFGDSNLDGFVTDDDLGYFLAGYGSDISGNPWILGDYNHDGFTTDDDLGFFLAAYGSTPGLAGGAIQAIPEPSTLVLGTLASLGLGALSLRRRRRAK